MPKKKRPSKADAKAAAAPTPETKATVDKLKKEAVEEAQETIKEAKKQLTIKRERFIHVYLQIGNACEAYRQVYDASNMNQRTVEKEASILLNVQEVSRRIREVREAAAKAMEVTAASIIEELEQARQAAFAVGQTGPMVQATMGKAKVAGIIVDKKEVTQTNVYKDITDEELHDMILSDAEALGIDLVQLAKHAKQRKRK